MVKEIVYFSSEGGGTTFKWFSLIGGRETEQHNNDREVSLLNDERKVHGRVLTVRVVSYVEGQLDDAEGLEVSWTKYSP